MSATPEDRARKDALRAWHPEWDEPGSPTDVAARRALAEDPSLVEWHARERAFDEALADRLSRAPTPPGLRQSILAKLQQNAAEAEAPDLAPERPAPASASAPKRRGWRIEFVLPDWSPWAVSWAASLVAVAGVTWGLARSGSVAPEVSMGGTTYSQPSPMPTMNPVSTGVGALSPETFLTSFARSLASIQSQPQPTRPAANWKAVHEDLKTQNLRVRSLPPSAGKVQTVGVSTMTFMGQVFPSITLRYNEIVYHMVVVDRASFPKLPELTRPLYLQGADLPLPTVAWTTPTQFFLLSVEGQAEHLQLLTPNDLDFVPNT